MKFVQLSQALSEEENAAYPADKFSIGQTVEYKDKKYKILGKKSQVLIIGANSLKFETRPEELKIVQECASMENEEVVARMVAEPAWKRVVRAATKKNTTAKFSDPKIQKLADQYATSLKTSNLKENIMDLPTEIKTAPAGVTTSLKKAIKEQEDCAKHCEGRNDDKASFALTVADAFKNLLKIIESGDDMMLSYAQIEYSKWMGPIQHLLPQDVLDFILTSTKSTTLRDRFLKNIKK